MPPPLLSHRLSSSLFPITSKPKHPRILTMSLSSSSYSSLPKEDQDQDQEQEQQKRSNSINQAIQYHQQTKHNFTNYARGPGRLDWSNQPNPFRRVSGLSKGLYFLVRNEDHFDDLRKAMMAEFTWRKPDGCPDDLPLYELAPGDCRDISRALSCHQDIASDGCFSLGMIAHFEPTLREKGAWMYPRLFWETGVLGQVLYLEAHAVGISATGIGCFFDDPVHEVLGLKGSDYQSLYHFTVGGPVVDKRIMSLPAYPGPDIDA